MRKPYTDEHKKFAVKLTTSELKQIRRGEYTSYATPFQAWIDAGDLYPDCTYLLQAVDAYAIKPPASKKPTFREEYPTYLIRYVPINREKTEELHRHFLNKFNAAAATYARNGHDAYCEFHTALKSHMCRRCGVCLQASVIESNLLNCVKHDRDGLYAVVSRKTFDALTKDNSLTAGDVDCESIMSGKYIPLMFHGAVDYFYGDD